MSSSSTPILPAAQPFRLDAGQVGVLILHGYGGTPADYRAIAEQVHQHGYTVSVPLLAGHGRGQEALRATTVAACQESVLTEVQQLAQQCSKIILLGSSFGGVLALDVAERYQMVHGLVLVNTALSYSGGGVFQGIALRILRLFRPDYPKKGLSDAEREYAASVGSAPAWPINGILATSSFAQKTVIPALPKVHIPTLILHSHEDPIVGTKNSELIANQIGSRDVRIETIPVATHRL
jgi:carboxylesterase